MMTDTGSMVTILQKKVTDKMGLRFNEMENTSIKIIGVSGGEIGGQMETTAVKMTCIRTGEHSVEKVFVSSTMNKSILSCDSMYRMSLLNPAMFSTPGRNQSPESWSTEETQAPEKGFVL